MCLIVLAWRRHRDFPLVIAANRDEFHARPADPMAWWEEQPTLLAGRDLRAGGTWLGVSRQGRIATVTNYRDAVPAVAEQSRGAHTEGAKLLTRALELQERVPESVERDLAELTGGIFVDIAKR